MCRQTELRDGFGFRHKDRFMGSGLGLGGGAIGLAPPPATISNGSPKSYQADTARFATKELTPPRRNQTMLTTFKMQLTRIALGRALLHLGCLLRGGRWDFHYAGIRRECRNMASSLRL